MQQIIDLVPPPGNAGYWDIINTVASDLVSTNSTPNIAMFSETLPPGDYQFEIRILASSHELADLEVNIAFNESPGQLTKEVWGLESDDVKHTPMTTHLQFSYPDAAVIDGYAVIKGYFGITNNTIDINVRFHQILTSATPTTVEEGTTWAIRKVA